MTCAPLYRPATLPRSLSITTFIHPYATTSRIALTTEYPGRWMTFYSSLRIRDPTFCSCTLATLKGKESVLMHAPNTAPLTKSLNVVKDAMTTEKDIDSAGRWKSVAARAARVLEKTKTNHYPNNYE